MDAWQAAAVALAIGFLIGAEREREGGPAGVRTFALAGLAGAGAALIDPIVLGFAAVGAAVIMAAGYLRPAAEQSPRLSTASSAALVLTVLLGGLAVSRPAVAAGAGVATAVILLAKQRLHHVIRDNVTSLELRDALKFFVAAFIVLPLMPHASLGPGGVLDPRRMWTFVVAVTALGWLGYVAVRLAGPERGLPAAGLAGGFVSSAATTGSMARTSRDPLLFRPAMAAALLATVASLIQLVLITAVADTRVARLLAPAVALGVVTLLGEAAWLLLRKGSTPAPPAGTITAIDFDDSLPGPPPPSRARPALVGRRPFDLMPALLLTAILTVFLLLSAVVIDALGPGAAVGAVAVAGLADSYAGALTAANLASQSELTTHTATLAVAAAVLANTIVKLILAHAAGGRRASLTLAVLLAGPAAAIAVGLGITLSIVD